MRSQLTIDIHFKFQLLNKRSDSELIGFLSRQKPLATSRNYFSFFLSSSSSCLLPNLSFLSFKMTSSLLQFVPDCLLIGANCPWLLPIASFILSRVLSLNLATFSTNPFGHVDYRDLLCGRIFSIMHCPAPMTLQSFNLACTSKKKKSSPSFYCHRAVATS